MRVIKVAVSVQFMWNSLRRQVLITSSILHIPIVHFSSFIINVIFEKKMAVLLEWDFLSAITWQWHSLNLTTLVIISFIHWAHNQFSQRLNGFGFQGEKWNRFGLQSVNGFGFCSLKLKWIRIPGDLVVSQIHIRDIEANHLFRVCFKPWGL